MALFSLEFTTFYIVTTWRTDPKSIKIVFDWGLGIVRFYVDLFYSPSYRTNGVVLLCWEHVKVPKIGQ
jgi:hypothetical protein